MYVAAGGAHVLLVPVWISVESVAVQPASMQPPPIPIQSEEASACRVCVTWRLRRSS